MFELPEGLVEVCRMPDDDDVDLAKPPAEIVTAVNATVSGSDAPEELLLWIDHQQVLQQRASEELVRLSEGGELDDPASRGLPGWISEQWSMVLRFPWSHRLEWAVDSAKSWM